jgi:polar amino acid transport system substrate-binding protein
MMRIFLLFSIALISNLCAFSETINIAWDPWCPWMCESTEKPGFSSELVEAVFKYSNIMVQYQKYSWPAAVFEAREGRVSALLAPAKKEAPDFIFSNRAIAFQQMCFYINNDFNWLYKGMKSLNNISFAVSQGAHYPGLMEYIQNNTDRPDKVQFIGTEDVYSTGFLILKQNKSNAFLSDYIPTEYYLKKNNLNNFFKRVGCLQRENLYLGFSPKFKDKSINLSHIFNKNLKIFKQSDEYQKLLDKYDIKKTDLN